MTLYIIFSEQSDAEDDEDNDDEDAEADQNVIDAQLQLAYQEEKAEFDADMRGDGGNDEEDGYEDEEIDDEDDDEVIDEKERKRLEEVSHTPIIKQKRIQDIYRFTEKQHGRSIW